MVFKKTKENKPKEENLSVKKEEQVKPVVKTDIVETIFKEDPVLETEVKEVHDILKELSKVGTKDSSKSKLNLGSVFKRWVIIKKNNKYVSDFGVIEKPYGTIKLLVKIENIGGMDKVVFAQLYPEPAFSIETIKANKDNIKKQFNRLKQIEKILEQNSYDGSNKFYKYNLKDIRLILDKKEIELEAIRYGTNFNYDHGLRKDGIPVLIYEIKNDSLYLQKGVEESNIIVEATEVKKISSLSDQKDINTQLPKNHRKDWLKIAWGIVVFLFTAGLVISFFTWASYNEGRAFNQCKERLDLIFQTNAKGFEQLYSEIPKTDNKILEELLNQNKVFIDLVTSKDEIEGDQFGRPSNK